MVEKRTYNYRQIMSEPVEIQKLTDKFSLPMPIKVTSIVIFLVVDIFMFFTIKDLIMGLNNQIPGMLLVTYIGVPYAVIKIFEKLKLDGLRLDQYLLSRFNFFRKITVTKKVVYQGSFVDTFDKPVIFSKIRKLEVKRED